MNNFSDEIFYLTQDREVRIRGRYLRLSANIEGLMAKSILLLNEVKTKRSGVETRIDLKHFMFKEKLKKFQSLLLEIYPDLSQSYTTLFGHIDNFREIRNKMAHCYFKWDNKNLDSVTIWDLDESTGVQTMQPYLYTLNEINENFRQSFINISEDLNKLSTEIIQRVEPEVPYMF
jgi:hypothetical protein